MRTGQDAVQPCTLPGVMIMLRNHHRLVDEPILLDEQDQK